MEADSALVRRGTVASIVLFVAFLAAWEWGPGLLGIPHFIVPPMSMVYDEFFRMWKVSNLPFHTGITAAEVLIGFVLGALLGALIGYLLGMSPTAELALSPYILALQIAPKVAFAPLFILWMGFTIYPKILVAILIVFFPVLINVLTAVRAVDPDLINLARSFKASRAQIFWKIEFPPRCRRCSPVCGSARRSRSSAWWWANWSAAIPGSVICSHSARARPTRRWCSSPSSC
jgi:NitT/TauT family transport system permease protein